MEQGSYDVIIIGCGPAGLGAALYTARDRFKTLVLEKFYPGGQINNTDRIENYPAFDNISGPDLIEKLMKQVTSFGAEIKNSSEVTSLKKLDDGMIEVACEDQKYLARAVILAPGSSYRNLGVPGEEEFRNAGAGVSYCGTCDAPFFKDKKVIAVGGGNTAIEEVLHLAKFCSEVVVVHRRQEFRATRVLTEELMAKVKEEGSNIKLQLDTVVTGIEGDGMPIVRPSFFRLREPSGQEEQHSGRLHCAGEGQEDEWKKPEQDPRPRGEMLAGQVVKETQEPAAENEGVCEHDPREESTIIVQRSLDPRPPPACDLWIPPGQERKPQEYQHEGQHDRRHDQPRPG